MRSEDDSGSAFKLGSNVVSFEEYKKRRNIIPFVPSVNNYQIFIIGVEELNDVSSVIDHIKNGEVVFVNTGRLDIKDKERFYCILRGACRGLDIVFSTISNGIYIAGDCIFKEQSVKRLNLLRQ